jgi:hypothetical protein
LRHVGRVAEGEMRLPAAGRDGVDDGRARARIAPCEDRDRAFLCETLNDAAADATRSADDQRDLTGKPH